MHVPSIGTKCLDLDIEGLKYYESKKLILLHAYYFVEVRVIFMN